ncbi:NAD(P)-dependent oxidoreductase [Falsirhodobacter sp. 1013]|uniref:NAD(P)-dependent oxidoreductase n=1 Tax=Falsirhodobacter sp. 1013 TaxID=3417566 RepID=UPI003EBFC845
MRVGVIGLGRMGGPIALHLSQAHTVTVLPPRGGYDGPLPCAADARALAEGSDLIVTVLRSSDEVAGLMSDLLAGAQPGLLHIDHCSGDPARSERFAQRWREVGCDYVDAALSGTPDLAAQGNLKLLCGGTADQIARVRSLATYAPEVIHAGGTGRGHMLRRIAGVMGYGIAALSAEILLMAEHAGIDPDHVHRMITGTGADSRTFQAVHARIPRAVPIAAVRRELAGIPASGPMLTATRTLYAQVRPDALISDLFQALKDPEHE